MDFFSTRDKTDSMTDQTPEGRPPALMKVLARLLRPLVRALIAQGVTAPAFYRLVKQVYVEVAERDFRLGDAPPTDSRISVLTGVHRRDVKTFREDAGAAERAAGAKVTTIASVIGRWLSSPDTTDAEGAPKPLPRAAKTGESFEALARAVSSDIRPKTVLDELERQNLVEIDAEGLVRLKGGAFIGPADLDQKVHFFAENVGDHIAAAVDNLLAEEPPFMERAVFYNRLRGASVDEIETTARTLGMEALVALNRRAGELQAEDREAEDGTERFRFGVFFYREDMAATDGAQNEKNGEDDDDRT